MPEGLRTLARLLADAIFDDAVEELRRQEAERTATAPTQAGTTSNRKRGKGRKAAS